MAPISNSDPKEEISGDGKLFTGTIKYDILHKMLDGKWYRLMLVNEDGIDKYYTDGLLSGAEAKEQKSLITCENDLVMPLGKINKNSDKLITYEKGTTFNP